MPMGRGRRPGGSPWRRPRLPIGRLAHCPGWFHLVGWRRLPFQNATLPSISLDLSLSCALYLSYTAFTILYQHLSSHCTLLLYKKRIFKNALHRLCGLQRRCNT
jgi:hypothetical protein